jgi:hypothetical protein
MVNDIAIRLVFVARLEVEELPFSCPRPYPGRLDCLLSASTGEQLRLR